MDDLYLRTWGRWALALSLPALGLTVLTALHDGVEGDAGILVAMLEGQFFGLVAVYIACQAAIRKVR